MRYLILLLLSCSTLSILAQQQNEQPKRSQTHGLGVNLMYDGYTGFVGEAVYERNVGRRFLLRAQLGGNFSTTYSFGFSGQYALVNHSRVKVLAGLGYHRIDRSLQFSSVDVTDVKAYTSVPLDIRARVSTNIWINAGIDLELSHHGTRTDSDYIASRLRLGAIYGF